MKKIGLLLLVLAALLVCVPAYAASTLGLGDTVARNGELAAFMNTTGSIYISGESSPMNRTTTSGIISIDAYRIVYFGTDGSLISIDLETRQETVLTTDAAAACCANDSVYYISRTDGEKLMCCDIETGSTRTVLTATEALQRVYNTSNGVIAVQTADAGAFILDSATDRFVAYNGDIADEIRTFNTFDVYSTANNELYVMSAGSLAGVRVDSNVLDWTAIGSTIYYLTGNSSSMTLKSYSTANSTYSIVFVPSIPMETQLTASANTLFMLGTDGTVYCVDVAGSRLVRFVSLPDRSSYSVGEGKQVSAFRIEAVSGQLNIYGTVTSTETLPTFTFVDSTFETVADTSAETVLLCAYAIEGEDTVATLLQPATQYTLLRRGSRGDAVSAIQQVLYDLGYYDYYIDGIYGWRTELGIKILQGDLGLQVTGKADADLQRQILSGELEPYDPYRELAYGSRGYRVETMQERLRDLGYLADDADGIFGVRTQSAVELFQEENNLTATGIATPETLRKLFSANAKECSSYIDLRRGDSGYRVRELNSRLKELYYLDGDVGSSYTAATADAVSRFQAEMGLRQTGRATPAVQSKLFARSAPEYSGYITLRRGDDNDRVEAMQRRLKKLGYFSGRCTGYYGSQTKDAVWLFERVCGLPADGVADPEMLAQLFDPGAPEYVEPTRIGVPEISLSDYDSYIGQCYSLSSTMNASASTTAFWYADGDVASYDVRLTDENGVVYVDVNSVDQYYLDISVNSLTEDLMYTLTVTAYPYEYASDAPTQSCIYFRRVENNPEPKPVENLIISPNGDSVSYSEGVYTLGDEELSFMWMADGDVLGYAYKVTDADGKAIYFSQDVADVRALKFAANTLTAGETYTMTVCAVPVDHELSDPETVASAIYFRIPESGEEPESQEASAQEPEVASLPSGLTVDDSQVQESAEADTEEQTVVAVEPDEGEPVIDEELSALAARSEEAIALAEAEAEPEAEDEEIPEAEPEAETEVLPETEPEEEAAPEAEPEEETEVVPETEPEEEAAPEAESEGETEVIPETESEAEPEVVPEAEPEPAEEPEEVAEEQGEPAVEPEPEAQPEIAPEGESEPAQVTIGELNLSVSPYDDIVYVNRNGSDGEQEVFVVGNGDLNLSWNAENAAHYHVVILDENNVEQINQDLSTTGATMSGSYLAEGVIYSLNVTAYANEDESVTCSATLLFSRSAPQMAAEEPAVVEDEVEPEQPAVEEEEVEPEQPAEEEQQDEPVQPAEEEQHDEPVQPAEEEQHDEPVQPAEEEQHDEPEQPAVEEEYVEPEQPAEENSNGYVEEYSEENANDYSVEANEAYTEEYADEYSNEYSNEYVEEDPEEEPVTEPETEPVTIGDLSLYVSQYDNVEYADNGQEVYVVGDYDLNLGWYADNAAYYHVQIVSEYNAELVNQDVNETGATMGGSYLEADVLYYVNVTAYANEDANVTSSATLLLKRSAPQVVEEEQYVEPEQPAEEYNDGYVEEYPEEYVEEYYEEYPEEYVEEYYEEYPEEYVEEYYEEYDDYEVQDEYMEEQMTDGNVMWANPIDVYSDGNTILTLQQRLVDWGWLSFDSCAQGVLDSVTVNAVIRLQQYMIECGFDTMICDAGNPMVDAGTLQLMFDDSFGVSFVNPGY